MTTIVPSPSPTTVDIDWPLPKNLGVYFEDTSAKAAEMFRKAFNARDVMRNAVLRTFEIFYTPETAPRSLKSIAVVVRTTSTPESKLSMTENFESGDLGISFSNQYIENVLVNDENGSEIAGTIIEHIASHIFARRFEDPSYPAEIRRGLASYVRLKQGFYLSNEDKKTTGTWYDFATMPYFLEWIEKKYGGSIVRQLFTGFGPQFDESVFEKVIGTPVSSLWEEYCTYLQESNESNENNENNESNKSNAADTEKDSESSLWPMPKFVFSVEDLHHEGVDIFNKACKPIDALTRAFEGVFETLYTLDTVPRITKEFRLVLGSGMGETTFSQNWGSLLQCEIVLSLDRVKYEQCPCQAAGFIMISLINAVVRWTAICCGENLTESQLLLRTVLVLLNDDLNDNRSGSVTVSRSEDGTYQAASSDQVKRFIPWIEASYGKGTIQKFSHHKRPYNFNHSRLAAITAKTLDELFAAYSLAPEIPDMGGRIPEMGGKIPENGRRKIPESRRKSEKSRYGIWTKLLNAQSWMSLIRRSFIGKSRLHSRSY